MVFRRILYATDFSSASRTALSRAMELAKMGGGAVTIVHVVEPPRFYLPEGAFPVPHVLAGVAAEAERGLAEWKQQAESLAPGIPVRALKLDGAAWDAIVRQAAEGYDLIVLGTHGRTGLKRALLGSVAERVTRHAPCAVLVVPAEPEPRA